MTIPEAFIYLEEMIETENLLSHEQILAIRIAQQSLSLLELLSISTSSNAN